MQPDHRRALRADQVVLAVGHSARDTFQRLVKEKLAATPTRHAYYPTARATWKRFAEPQKSAMRTELERIRSGAGRSADVYEIAARALD